MSRPFVTRFAPSPSGLLHLGHAYSALLAARSAEQNHGLFLLRIEDIDVTRCRPEFEQAIYQDLAWLDLDWEEPVRRQSDHFADYKSAIRTLDEQGLLYPCFCTRKDIQIEIQKSANAPHGPDGVLYPGICRYLGAQEKTQKINAGAPYALRLDVNKAVQTLGQPLTFREKGKVTSAQPEILGDAVIARKDIMTSYHLSVVVDDHLQSVTHVIRGQDLCHTTHIHRLLQASLGLKAPKYHHHGLLAGADGKRFAKRNKSITLKSLREAGATPGDVIGMIKTHGGEDGFPENELRF